MGKKTVPIADQTTPGRRVFMPGSGNDISVIHVAGSFRIKPIITV